MAVRPGDSHHRANWTPLPHQSQSHLGPDRSARYFTGGLVKSRHRLVGRSPLKTNRSSLFPPAGHTRPTGHPFSVRPSVRPLPQCDKSTDRWRRTNWSRLSAGPGARGQLAALLVRPSSLWTPPRVPPKSSGDRDRGPTGRRRSRPPSRSPTLPSPADRPIDQLVVVSHRPSNPSRPTLNFPPSPPSRPGQLVAIPMIWRPSPRVCPPFPVRPVLLFLPFYGPTGRKWPTGRPNPIKFVSRGPWPRPPAVVKGAGPLWAVGAGRPGRKADFDQGCPVPRF